MRLLGKYLHSSCSDLLFGRVIGESESIGASFVDILVYNPTEIMIWDTPGNIVDVLGTLPPVVVACVEVSDVEEVGMKPDNRGSFTGHVVHTKAPWGGCYRCNKCFLLLDNPSPEYYRISREVLDRMK